MIRLLFLLIFFFITGFLEAQKTQVYYSQFASKTTKDHSVTLLKFIKYISQKNVTGVIDGYDISFQKEIQINNLNNVDLIFRNSQFRAVRRFNGAFLSFTNTSNISISGLVIKQYQTPSIIYQESDYPELFNNGLSFIRSSNISVTNSQFWDLYTRSIMIKESKGKIIISNNSFSSPLQKQMYLAEHIMIGSSPNAMISIEKNSFDNQPYSNPDVGVSAISGYGLGKNGGQVIVKNNYFNYVGRNNAGKHRLYAIDFYDDCDNIKVIDNQFENVMWGAIRFDGSSENVEISSNRITVKNPDDSGTISSSTTSRVKSYKNILINNNQIKSLAPLNSTILLQNQFVNVKTENIVIKNNAITDSYYNVYVTGFMDGITIDGNRISGSLSVFGIYFLLNPNQGLRNINTISNNEIIASNTGISINSKDNLSNFSEFAIVNNNISNSKKKEGFGILLNIGSKGKFKIEQNIITNYGKGIYLREKKYKLNFNKFVGNKNNLQKD